MKAATHIYVYTIYSIVHMQDECFVVRKPGKI